MILTIEQIAKKSEPILRKYEIKEAYLFGSVARGEATEESDVDFLIDRTDSKLVDLFIAADFREELEKALGKFVDVINTHMMESQTMQVQRKMMRDNILKERVLIYTGE
ncbi:putative nucleotidyltransferase [Enterococcus sp. PF1-24]|uniref:nucleotidyltransferase family protein n=1 Tax=unclassified Enterococcus TaxID=2608891 RepID=UPI0024757492|nr:MULTISPECIES: nucleotidyltransferase domain-containing protein [unclassified Enterococcus]MDH6363694.1 putative nucleotidyltransferase [Enterococcus sp. PFB1-1]MDH6400650.1 putative nucleotidyltransferase [Enterococcus sp. PF1-24]